MILSWKQVFPVTLLGLVALGAAGQRADAALVVSYEAPGVQATTLAGTTTETFNGTTPSTYTTLATAVGTLTSTGGNVHTADLYGGANGTGNYFTVGTSYGLSASLALGTTRNYFGFYLSALDMQNGVDIYSGTTLLGSLNAPSLISTLSPSYNGNPSAPFLGQDPNERFVYVNFFGTSGTTFDRIVFRNISGQTGLELDNFSTLSNYTGAPTGTVLTNGLVVPEPSSLALVGMGGLVGCGAWLRRRRVA